jgi:hypothetical protein
MGQYFGMAIRGFPDDHVDIGLLIDGLFAIAAKNNFGHRLLYLKKTATISGEDHQPLAE